MIDMECLRALPISVEDTMKKYTKSVQDKPQKDKTLHNRFDKVSAVIGKSLKGVKSITPLSWITLGLVWIATSIIIFAGTIQVVANSKQSTPNTFLLRIKEVEEVQEDSSNFIEGGRFKINFLTKHENSIGNIAKGDFEIDGIQFNLPSDFIHEASEGYWKGEGENIYITPSKDITALLDKFMGVTTSGSISSEEDTAAEEGSPENTDTSGSVYSSDSKNPVTNLSTPDKIIYTGEESLMYEGTLIYHSYMYLDGFTISILSKSYQPTNTLQLLTLQLPNSVEIPNYAIGRTIISETFSSYGFTFLIPSQTIRPLQTKNTTTIALGEEFGDNNLYVMEIDNNLSIEEQIKTHVSLATGSVEHTLLLNDDTFAVWQPRPARYMEWQYGTARIAGYIFSNTPDSSVIFFIVEKDHTYSMCLKYLNTVAFEMR